MTKQLLDIINDCWREFNAFSANYKVMPSIPILWFGDMEAYLRSQTKVVSVALNPSELEFREQKDSVFSIETRFKDFLDDFNPDNYYDVLNGYFKYNPYWKWFKSPERVLNCLDASYKSGYNNTALHLDIYAPVATTPHWNGLSINQRNQLCSSFEGYFDRLINELSPNTIIASLSQNVIAAHFRDINNLPCKANTAFKTWNPPAKKGFEMRYYKLLGGASLITGRNMSGTAFGGLTVDECKLGIEEIIS
jgi:hypothetical protein